MAATLISNRKSFGGAQRELLSLFSTSSTLGSSAAASTGVEPAVGDGRMCFLGPACCSPSISLCLPSRYPASLPLPHCTVTVDELGLSDRLRGPSSSGMQEAGSPASPEFTQPVPATASGRGGAWSAGV